MKGAFPFDPATKEDLRLTQDSLEQRLEILEQRIETRMGALELRLTLRVGAMLTAGVAIVVALVKLL